MRNKTAKHLECPSVTELLAIYKGKKVFFDPMWGNNGDKLIEMGSLEVLKKAGVQLVKNPNKAELIIINGGGAMTRLWKHGFSILKRYSQQYPKIPLVVLPSSWLFDSVNPTIFFSKRSAPCYLYAREPYSLTLLQGINFKGEIYLGLDHDMAFHLRGTDYIHRLQAKQSQRHILVVERGDIESATGLQHNDLVLTLLIQRVIPRSIMDIIPRAIQSVLRDLIVLPERFLLSRKRRKRAEQTVFAKRCVEMVRNKYPEFRKLPVYAADISLPSICNFNQFSLAVAQAGIVITTRLHVAILSSLLGKPCYLKLGKWYKIRGVYEYSLKEQGYVKLF